MTPEVLLAFALFAWVSSITPGPNNLMVLSSGLNFGFRASVPHVLGISIGFGVMLVAVGLGLALVFERWPVLYQGLKVVGVLYLLWLAWGLARAGSLALDRRDGAPRPLGFWGAAAFQWVNPKAWVMAVSAFATYMPANGLGPVLLTASLFALINLPSVAAWALCGSQLRHWLAEPARQRLFNRGMAALLVLSLLPLLF
ncbi:LysE family translocator [Inhella gelatinilytica]|uniref:LysE family translocator n=1 Tax=Inhella gelatinilytica TaxID=2795030 RepID=A0A931N9Q9_9BURK|nr:LysE family translocator [Inhella gelatinilytica]MBH9551628.1 LysE family translocator [Inhella gelatinilytica]